MAFLEFLCTYCTFLFINSFPPSDPLSVFFVFIPQFWLPVCGAAMFGRQNNFSWLSCVNFSVSSIFSKLFKFKLNAIFLLNQIQWKIATFVITIKKKSEIFNNCFSSMTTNSNCNLYVLTASQDVNLVQCEFLTASFSNLIRQFLYCLHNYLIISIQVESSNCSELSLLFQRSLSILNCFLFWQLHIVCWLSVFSVKDHGLLFLCLLNSSFSGNIKLFNVFFGGIKHKWKSWHSNQFVSISWRSAWFSNIICLFSHAPLFTVCNFQERIRVAFVASGRARNLC